VDSTGRPPFAITGRRVPVVPVVHNVHRLTNPDRSRTSDLVTRVLSGPVARRGRDDRAIVVLSASARHELRRRLGIRGPIFVVPAGTAPVPATRGRAADPTVVVVAPLVREQRIDLLLRQLAPVAERAPRLKVEIIGDGPELPRLRHIANAAGIASTVTLHGQLPHTMRDAWLRRAWLTVSTATDVCGCAVLEAATRGVPCVGLAAVGIRDFVRDGRTGDIVDTVDLLGATVLRQLTELADEDHASRMADRCREWANRFRWDRGAELLAGVVAHQIGAHSSRRHGVSQRRYARSDIATLVQFPVGTVPDPGALLRATDEVGVHDGVISMLLNGCDEFDALGVLDRLGVPDARMRLANWDDLLIGPGRPFAHDEHHEGINHVQP
jgi:glycosyltransferase involved in cell wall biosynthesis